MGTSVASRQPLVQQDTMHADLAQTHDENNEPVISPIIEFHFFHQAIRAELERLHQDALAIEKGSEKEIDALRSRYLFLRAVYKHHSRAEDEVSEQLSYNIPLFPSPTFYRRIPGDVQLF
jgi:hypothetical protein